MQIMKLLSNDLGKAEHKITDLAQKPVRERMAEAILFLKETYGTENDGKTLNISLSREEIANVVGTATETAIRLLSEFKSDQIIELQAKKIKIINSEKLLKTANIHD
jgi:CRP/FNR family transcriptional regulator